MKLVLLFGDTAVGKMTVGQELCRITGLRLFHNHQMIEPVLATFGSFDARTILRLREVVFEEFAASGQYGLVHTFMWAFDQKEDWDYAAHIAALFEAKGAEVYYVELDAPQAVRLARNRSENRLANKTSKRDLAASEQRLLEDDRHYRCVSREGELPFKNYLRIENADVSAAEAARRIQERFEL